MHIIHGHWSMAVVGQRLTNVYVFVAVLDQDSETQLPASDTMPVAATQTPRQPSRKKDTPKTVRGTDKKGHVRGTGKKDMPKTGQGPVQPKMPKRMVEFQRALQKPGQVITVADIKASYDKKLRNNAMNAMVYSLSKEQQVNYKNCQSDRQRHEWVK